MTDAERVVFLLQPAGKAYLDELIADSVEWETLVANALVQYVDPRLAAAFVLETLCNAARVSTTASKGQTKSLTVGPIKIEKVVNSNTAESVRADAFCAQAVRLRREVRRARSGVIQLASPTFVPAKRCP